MYVTLHSLTYKLLHPTSLPPPPFTQDVRFSVASSSETHLRQQRLLQALGPSYVPRKSTQRSAPPFLYPLATFAQLAALQDPPAHTAMVYPACGHVHGW
jgi:hypothetical protein